MLTVNFYTAFTGGVLIGIASLLLFWCNGRIAGISGILGGLLDRVPDSEQLWRICFLLGLLLGGWLVVLITGHALPLHLQVNEKLMVAAGFLVGFGSRLGSGCTSGHGVCGIGRLSRRSITATLIFMGSGIVTLYFVRHLLEWGIR